MAARPGALAVFLLLSGCTGIAVGVLVVTVPLYALSLQASPAQLGLIRAASGAGLLVAALPAALALLVFCDGAARALQLSALTTIFSQALPRFGVQRIGWHRGALSLGLSFAGPLLGGALVGGFGFGASFAGVIALAVLANLLLRWIAIPTQEPTGRAGHHPWRAHMTRLPALLRAPDVATCLATEALVSATFCTFSTFIVVLAVTELHLAPATAALAGTALAAPSLAMLSATPSPALLLLASVTLGVGLGLLNLVATARAAALSITAGADHKGGVASMFMLSSSLGGAFGPALAGGVASWGGTQAAFLSLMPLFALLGAAVVAPAGAGTRSGSLIG